MPIDFKNIQHLVKEKRHVLLKAVAIGGSFGMLGIVASKAMKKRDALRFDALNETGNATLGAEPHVAMLCTRLQPYKAFDAAAFDTILIKFAELLHLNNQVQEKQVVLKLSMRRRASLITSEITSAVWRLRIKLRNKMGTNLKVMDDFDDIASTMQQACTDINFNLNMEIAHYFSK